MAILSAASRHRHRGHWEVQGAQHGLRTMSELCKGTSWNDIKGAPRSSQRVSKLELQAS